VCPQPAPGTRAGRREQGCQQAGVYGARAARPLFVMFTRCAEAMVGPLFFRRAWVVIYTGCAPYRCAAIVWSIFFPVLLLHGGRGVCREGLSTGVWRRAMTSTTCGGARRASCRTIPKTTAAYWTHSAVKHMPGVGCCTPCTLAATIETSSGDAIATINRNQARVACAFGCYCQRQYMANCALGFDGQLVLGQGAKTASNRKFFRRHKCTYPVGARASASSPGDQPAFRYSTSPPMTTGYYGHLKIR
jgi:hypothetical protein